MKEILCNSIRKCEKNVKFKRNVFKLNSSDLTKIIIKDSRAVNGIVNSLYFVHFLMKTEIYPRS